MNAKILRLNKAGIPVSWLTREETATLLVKDLVIWSMGDTVMEIRGGYNREGVQSVLKLPSIVAAIEADVLVTAEQELVFQWRIEAVLVHLAITGHDAGQLED